MQKHGIIYEGEVNEKLGMPMGGLGTGTIEIDRAGRFQNIAVQNNWSKSLKPAFAGNFVSVYARSEEKETGRVLQIEGPGKLDYVKGLKYHGHFPFVNIDYQDDDLPCEVSLETFSPFVPHDADASSLPLVFFSFNLRNPGKSAITAAAALSWQNDIAIEPWAGGLHPQGNYNFLIEGGSRGVLMTTKYKSLCGSEYLLTCVPAKGVEYQTVADWWQGKPGKWLGPKFLPGKEEAVNRWEEFLQTGKLPSERQAVDELGEFSYHCPVGAVSGMAHLEPGEEKEIRFALAWFFPHHNDRTGHYLGHYYARRFPNGTRDVICWASERFNELRERSKAWHKLIDEASLPDNTRNLMVNTLYLMARATWWLADGRFLNYESIDCPLTNPVLLEQYSAPGMAAMFPDQHACALRNIAEYQLPSGEIPTFLGRGSVHEPKYRVFSPHDVSAYVLSVYWEMMWGGGGDRFAVDMYPVAKKVLQWGKTLDVDNDGVPDCHGIDQGWDTWPMFGAASYIADLWLAALTAGKKMADYFKDKDFAEWCRTVRKKAGEAVENHLWNGSYYQLYDDSENKKSSDACFLDQFAGQTIAGILDLGILHPKERIQKALDAVWRHNVEPCKHCARSGAKPDGSADTSSTDNAQSNAFVPASIATMCATAMRCGKIDQALELMEEMSDIIINKAKDPWHGLLLFDGDTGEHFYGKHYIDNLILWDVLHALTGFSVNILERTLVLNPPRIPVKGPIFTKIYYGQVEFAVMQSEVKLVLSNASQSPSLLRQLRVRLPEEISGIKGVIVNGKDCFVKTTEDRFFLFNDVVIPSEGILQIIWKRV